MFRIIGEYSNRSVRFDYMNGGIGNIAEVKISTNAPRWPLGECKTSFNRLYLAKRLDRFSGLRQAWEKEREKDQKRVA